MFEVTLLLNLIGVTNYTHKSERSQFFADLAHFQDSYIIIISFSQYLIILDFVLRLRVVSV